MWSKIGWLLKRFPHPTYGNYGGYYRRCKNRKLGICPMPIDWMDRVFEAHDDHLVNNKELVKLLKAGNLNPLSKLIYGTLYKWGTIRVFAIANFFYR